MYFSVLKPRQRLAPINKKSQQPRRKLSKIMAVFFSLMGIFVFWVGLKVRKRYADWARRTKSSLPPFVRPAPHLLPSHATLAQVDAYINFTHNLGSMQYLESTSCKKHFTCEIHFPFLDIDDTTVGRIKMVEELKRGNHNGRTDYAVLTRKGSKALVTNVKANQDRAFIVAPLEMGEETALVEGPDDFLMGLFDGHGPIGHGTSHFASMELPPLVLRSIQRRKKFIPAKQSTDGIKAAIKDSFITLDENIPFLENSGSTGILILRIGDFLFLASTGDSLAFLVKYDTSQDVTQGLTIVQRTVPHKPDQPMESARIKSSGGQILPQTTPDTSSRVIIPGKDGIQMALAMSRSLGDPEGKEANVIIADPNVDVVDLSELRQNGDPEKDKYFMIVASDGLLDKVPPKAVAERIAQSFYVDKPSQPLLACNELIMTASQLWMAAGPAGMGYRDDISIAVKMIDM